MRLRVIGEIDELDDGTPPHEFAREIRADETKSPRDEDLAAGKWIDLATCAFHGVTRSIEVREKNATSLFPLTASARSPQAAR